MFLSADAKPYAFSFDPAKTALILGQFSSMLASITYKNSNDLDRGLQLTFNAISLRMAGLVIFRVVILRQSKNPLGQLLRSLNSPGEQVLLLCTLGKDTSLACETAPRAKLVQIPLT